MEYRLFKFINCHLYQALIQRGTPLTSLGDGARVARGATYMFLQGMISNVIGVVFIAILARLISQEEMGVYAMLTFVLTAVQALGVFALPSASAKYIAKYTAEKSPEKARSVITRVLQISFVAAIMIFILIYVAADWLSTIVFGTSEWTQLFQISAFVSFFTIFYIQIRSFLQGLQKLQELAAFGLAYTLIQKSVALYLLLLPGWGLYSIPWSLLASVVISCFIGLVLTARFVGVLGKPHSIRTLANFSYPLYISSSLSFVAGWVDQIFILPFMGAVYLGMYHIAVRAIAVPSLIISSIVTALFPKLSELHAQRGKTSLRGAFSISTRYAVMIGFPMIVGIASLAHPVLVFFAGPEYSEAALPLTILCLSVLQAALGVAVGPILMTLERTRTLSMIAIITILFNTAVSYFTLAYLNLGMLGTALARVLSAFLGFGLAIYALKRIVEVTFDKESLWKTSLASAFMVIVIAFLSYFLEGIMSPVYLLSLSVIIGAFVYFGSLVVLRAVKKQDIELIREYLPERLRRVAVWLDRLVLAK
jgi:O-antigen/teichoic acid export membrane protein